MKNNCIVCALKSRAATRLSDEEIEKLSVNCAVVTIKKGNSLIRQGTFSTNVAYLRSGLAKLHITGPYREQIVRIVKAPGYLGLPTTFGDKINQYSATVIEDAEVCFIDIRAFRLLLRSNPDFSYEILLEVCRNELEVFYRCANRTQKQVRGKIADVLIELADKIYNSSDFRMPLSQEDIGNLIDASRETVSRILNEFEVEEIITISGKNIGIRNRKLLEMISANG